MHMKLLLVKWHEKNTLINLSGLYLSLLYQAEDYLPHEEREEIKAYDKRGEWFHKTDRLKVENGYLLPLKSLLKDLQHCFRHFKTESLQNNEYLQLHMRAPCSIRGGALLASQHQGKNPNSCRS